MSDAKPATDAEIAKRREIMGEPEPGAECWEDRLIDRIDAERERADRWEEQCAIARSESRMGKRIAALEAERDAAYEASRETEGAIAEAHRVIEERNERIAELEAALRQLLQAIDAIGGAQAWHGSMGDDGQGHDEGEIVAHEMLAKAKEALGDE